MNILTVLLSIILIWFQYDLWIGKNGVYELICIKNMIASYQDEDFISIIRERNDRLFNEIYDLKHGFDIIEEKSRNELGMIKIGETFYQFSKDGKLEYDCEKEY